MVAPKLNCACGELRPVSVAEDGRLVLTEHRTRVSEEWCHGRRDLKPTLMAAVRLLKSEAALSRAEADRLDAEAAAMLMLLGE